MADSSIFLSSAAEAELLKLIDEYVGKIQAQIDELPDYKYFALSLNNSS